MISPKLGVLMATMALIGAGALPMVTTPMALAQEQNADVDIERNNEIIQENRQFQEACRGEARVQVNTEGGVDIGNENRAEVEQGPNVCDVGQNQEATNAAAIVDESVNTFDITNLVPNCRDILPGAVIPSECLPT